MIGKISKGAGFRGCVNYVLGKPDARLLAAEYNGLFSSPAYDETEYLSACGTYLAQLCT